MRLKSERFPNWTKLIRVQAWVIKFINNCRVGENRRLLDHELLFEGINGVETQIVRKMQKEMFSEKYNALIKKVQLPKQQITSFVPSDR